MALRDTLRSARLQRKMTLASLAAASGVTKGFLSQVETGRSKPSLTSLERIANALGLPVSRLLESGESGDRSTFLNDASQATLIDTDATAGGASVVRAESWRQSKEAIVPIAAGVGERFAVARLLPGQVLQPAGGTEVAGSSLRFCCVLEGEVIVNQGGSDVVLARDDLLARTEGAYRIENRGVATAHVLLAMGLRDASLADFGPQGNTQSLDFGLQVAMTDLQDSEVKRAETAMEDPKSKTQYYDMRGPLRLAAMRAMRDGARERKGR